MYDLQLTSNSEGISMILVRFIHHHPTFEIKLFIFKAMGRGKILPGSAGVPAVQVMSHALAIGADDGASQGLPQGQPLVFCGHVVRPVGRFSS
jgi:hypothetical protein